MLLRPTTSTLFPYTTLFRSLVEAIAAISGQGLDGDASPGPKSEPFELILVVTHVEELRERFERRIEVVKDPEDRKSTRLNSSHLVISYAVFCFKKKRNKRKH